VKNILLAGTLLASSHAYATTVTFCGPDNGTGCELAGEQKVFLNEIHDSATITGNVGAQNSGPVIIITADQGTFDSFLDAGGGFATIDASHGFKAFNGVDITIPGYTFTDLVFTVQMERQGGRKGDTEIDTFDIRPFTRIANVETLDADKPESVSPDAAFEYNVLATSGFIDEVNLFAQGPPLSGGFFEIKHLQVSGLAVAAVPEPSTWLMGIVGFGLVGLIGWRKTRNVSAAA
jgi:hypothetical protein